jgi:hypothetical protein
VRVDERLTDEDLDRIEARANAVFAEPWEAFVEGRDHWGGDEFIRTAGLDDSSPDRYVSSRTGRTNLRDSHVPVLPQLLGLLDARQATHDDGGTGRLLTGRQVREDETESSSVHGQRASTVSKRPALTARPKAS